MSIEEARSWLKDLIRHLPPYLASLIELADQLLNEFHVSNEKRRTLVTQINTVVIRALLEASQSFAIDAKGFEQMVLNLYRLTWRYSRDIIDYARLDALCSWLRDLVVMLDNNYSYMRWVNVLWESAEKAVKMVSSG